MGTGCHCPVVRRNAVDPRAVSLAPQFGQPQYTPCPRLRATSSATHPRGGRASGTADSRSRRRSDSGRHWIPRQERSMADHREKLHCIMIRVGAAFDLLGRKTKEAPAWTRDISREWVFRFLLEPRRLCRRYLKQKRVPGTSPRSSPLRATPFRRRTAQEVAPAQLPSQGKRLAPPQRDKKALSVSTTRG